jgi:predicted ATPase
MIVSAAFKNFLALRDVQIDLEPFTVIVGPNACGKTTTLEGLHRMNSLRKGIISVITKQTDSNLLESAIIDPSEVISKGSGRFIDLSIQIKIGHETVSFSSRLDAPPLPSQGYWTFATNSPELGYKNEGVPYGNMTSISYDHTRLLEFLPESTFLRLNGSVMSRPSYSKNLNAYLESDGAGLATVCANLQLGDPEIFEKVQLSLQSIVPGLKRFRIRRSIVPRTNWFNVNLRDEPANLSDKGTGEELIFDFHHAENVSASFVSEGTLLALAILVASASNSNNQIILLDDIERGLHPRATRNLIHTLRELQQLNPNLQIVATTHSPYILNQLEPKEVRVATLEPGRGTLIARLEDHPDFEKWNEEMLPGELWSNVGEDWVRNLQKT